MKTQSSTDQLSLSADLRAAQNSTTHPTIPTAVHVTEEAQLMDPLQSTKSQSLAQDLQPSSSRLTSMEASALPLAYDMSGSRNPYADNPVNYALAAQPNASSNACQQSSLVKHPETNPVNNCMRIGRPHGIRWICPIDGCTNSANDSNELRRHVYAGKHPGVLTIDDVDIIKVPFLEWLAGKTKARVAKRTYKKYCHLLPTTTTQQQPEISASVATLPDDDQQSMTSQTLDSSSAVSTVDAAVQTLAASTVPEFLSSTNVPPFTDRSLVPSHKSKSLASLDAATCAVSPLAASRMSKRPSISAVRYVYNPDVRMEVFKTADYSDDEEDPVVDSMRHPRTAKAAVKATSDTDAQPSKIVTLKLSVDLPKAPNARELYETAATFLDEEKFKETTRALQNQLISIIPRTTFREARKHYKEETGAVHWAAFSYIKDLEDQIVEEREQNAVLLAAERAYAEKFKTKYDNKCKEKAGIVQEARAKAFLAQKCMEEAKIWAREAEDMYHDAEKENEVLKKSVSQKRMREMEDGITSVQSDHPARKARIE